MSNLFRQLSKRPRTRRDARRRAKLLLRVLNIFFTLLAIVFTYIVCQALRQLLDHVPHR